MAISHIFNGQVYKLPGVYAATKSLVSVPSIPASFSRALIVQANSEFGGFGGGAGVIGDENIGTSGKNSIYRLRSAAEMKSFTKGGYWSVLSDALFNPSNVRNTPGVSDVFFIRACKTTAAKMVVNVGNSQTITVYCRDEGTWANSNIPYDPITPNLNNAGHYIDDGDEKILKKGYACRFVQGVRDEEKIMLQFWIGTYSGNYNYNRGNPTANFVADGLPYNEISFEDATPQLVLQSPEFENSEDLFQWMKTNAAFDDGFLVIQETPVSGTLEPVLNEWIFASGGTETGFGGQEAESAVIEAIKGMDVSFIITDYFGIEQAKNNFLVRKLQAYVNDIKRARFEKFLIVGGGITKNEFSPVSRTDPNNSVAIARSYDNDYVWLVHGGIKLFSNISTRLREWDSLYHTCYIVGRIAGMPPQVPPTFKEINIAGLIHEMTDTEKEDALDAGVLTTYFDDDFLRYTILKGINTLQNNNMLVNPDGTSPSIQARRISSQINKEMIIDAKVELFSQREGVTVLSLPPASVQEWIGTKLAGMISRGLILSYQNISVSREQDALFVRYEFRINSEINYMFISGFLLE